MGLILDSSVLISIEKELFDFGKIESVESVFISAITITELLEGVLRANTLERRLKRSAFVEHVIGSIPALPFSEEEARIYAQLLSSLRDKHTTLGAHDLIIASTAIAGGHKVVTFDNSDFRRIPGVEIIAPQDL